MNTDQLRSIVANPSTSPADRATARRQLESLGEPDDPGSENKIEAALLRFSGARRLQDVRPESVFNFYDMHRPAPDELTSLAALWKLFRVLNLLSDPTQELWDSLADLPPEQRKADFTTKLEHYPFLQIPEVVRQARVDELNILRGFCENFPDERPRYAVQLKQLLARMKPYEFQARRTAEILLATCEGRDPWKDKDQHDLRKST